MPKRALFRQDKGAPSPRAAGRRFASGISTSSIMMKPVGDARTENLPSIFGLSRPFIPFSRMKPPILPSSSLAQTTKTSAMGLLVIQFLEPESL